MVYLSYVKPFREDYLNKLLVLNEFFLITEAGFMVLFCTPFGSNSMDLTYSNIQFANGLCSEYCHDVCLHIDCGECSHSGDCAIQNV